MQRFKGWCVKKIMTDKEEGSGPLLCILYTLNVLGRIPFTRNGAGGLQFRVLSLPTAWAVGVASLQMYLVSTIYVWHFSRLKPSDDFDKTISTINDLLFLNTSCHGVLATWPSTPRIIRAVNRWKDFHKQVQSTISKPLTSVLLDHSYLGVLFVSVGISLMFINSYLSYTRLQFFEVVIDAVYFVCIFYFNIFLWLWIVICIMVKRTAELLNHHLIQVLSDSPTADDILCLRRLWMEMHASTTDLVDGLSSTLQMWKALGFTINLFTVYGLLSLAFSGKFGDLSFLLSALVVSSVAGFLVFTVSDSAQTSVSSDIASTICCCRWSALSGAVQSQLGLLLDAVEMGTPCFEVRGTYVIDKAYYMSLQYGIITNLVVLMQFKVSTSSVVH